MSVAPSLRIGGQAAHQGRGATIHPRGVTAKRGTYPASRRPSLEPTSPPSSRACSTAQRAAWSVGDKKTVVFETGLNNLTQDHTTVLIHYGTESTQQITLVRLEQPPDEKK